MERKYWITIIALIVLAVVGISLYQGVLQTEEVYIPEHRNASNNASIVNYSNYNASDSAGIWSGIVIEMNLTKDGVTKSVVGDINFVFSEKPSLIIQSYNISQDDKSAVFLIKTPEGGEFIEMNVGETYYYEPQRLIIHLISIDTSGACPEGMMC